MPLSFLDYFRIFVEKMHLMCGYLSWTVDAEQIAVWILH
jgi:hypothetical protein